MGGTNGGAKRLHTESQEDGWLDAQLYCDKIEGLKARLAVLTEKRDVHRKRIVAILRWVGRANSQLDLYEDQMAGVRDQIDEAERQLQGRLRALREDNAEHHRRVCALHLSVCRLGEQQDPGQPGELVLFARRHEPIQLHPAPEPAPAA